MRATVILIIIACVAAIIVKAIKPQSEPEIYSICERCGLVLTADNCGDCCPED